MLCVIGSALAIGMAAAAWHSAPTFLQPGQMIDGERFNGTAQQGRQALTLMLTIGIGIGIPGLAFAGLGV